MTKEIYEISASTWFY